jgi:hypothetical protein
MIGVIRRLRLEDLKMREAAPPGTPPFFYVAFDAAIARDLKNPMGRGEDHLPHILLFSLYCADRAISNAYGSSFVYT